jgi:DNA-binding response OmpR family regulator
VPDVLIASEAPWVHDEVEAALTTPRTTARRVTAGRAVRPALQERLADLVVLDMQIGNMGGMATCLDLRLEESGGRLPHVPVLMLLDRYADIFLARRSGAEGWLVKPLDSLRVRRAVDALLGGGRYEDAGTYPLAGAVPQPSYIPSPDASAAG